MSGPRWFTDTGPDHSRRYVERFRRLAAEGADLDGEARLVDVLVRRQARILDAGCGGGRTAAALHARGHDLVGVDVDPLQIAAAAEDHPGPRWVVRDLAELTLDDVDGEPVDAAVLAGNVLVYVTPGRERDSLAGVAACVQANGVIVIGFATDRAYGISDLDRDAAALGLELEHRFATWDLRPWRADADWAVSVLRLPA